MKIRENTSGNGNSNGNRNGNPTLQQNVHICAEDQHKDQDKHKCHAWKAAGRGGTVSESHLRK